MKFDELIQIFSFFHLMEKYEGKNIQTKSKYININIIISNISVINDILYLKVNRISLIVFSERNRNIKLHYTINKSIAY